ncbi:hypothetical protein M2447_001597 [Ereboglobus sp. PH5-10]|nr:hypothetical protein [Ereboglobus sp. PH5-10]
MARIFSRVNITFRQKYGTAKHLKISEYNVCIEMRFLIPISFA